ncbi:Haloacid dehalogenase superfamily, subfamily IA, variant 1 with third motif having Dx(3-4)D or Dx(3-4)E [Burkholderia latens]
MMSFDIFDTLIFRRCSPDAVLHSVSMYLDHEVAARGIAIAHGGALGAYHAAYAKLARRSAAHGQDDEVYTTEIYGEWVREAVGGGDPELAENVRAKMREIELQVCEANPLMRPVLERIRSTGVRMIYISDMYIGNECVSAILEKARLLDLFDAGYVSSDHALLKRTGRLFQFVLEREGVQPSRVLHCGDNPHSDGDRAANAGLQAVIVRDKQCIERYESMHYRYLRWLVNPRGDAGALAASFAQSMPGDYLTAPEAYARRVLGPIYASFMHRVVERCFESGIEQVFFLAREGFFLKQIFEKIASRRHEQLPIPRTTYLGVSRLTALFLGTKHFGMREVSLALSNGPRNLSNLFSALRISEEKLAAIGARHGMPDIHAILPEYFMSWGPFLALLDDPEISVVVSARHEESRELLEQYLQQEGFFDHKKVAIVDVGWAGQIQDSLYRGCRDRADCPQIFGYYLGMNLTGHHRKSPGNWMEWVICDQCHLEWNGISALQFPQSFEAITRSPHGTVIGYERKGDVVEPVLKADDVPSRQAEMLDDGLIALLQAGILDYVDHYATAISMLRLDAGQTLAYGKQLTGRMVRFPTFSEAGYLLRLNNVSDLGAGTLYQMGGVDHLSVLRPRRLKNLLRSSFWKYGTLALTGRAATLLQLVWNVRVDARSLPVRRASLDHGIAFHRPADVSDEARRTVVETVRRSRLGEDIPEVTAALVQKERRKYRYVDAHRATQPLTLHEALKLYGAWRISAAYAKWTKRHMPSISAEPLGTYFRQALFAQPGTRRAVARIRRVIARK